MILPNVKFRISPALWEEPRCYWCTGGVDQIVTLRELTPNSRSKCEFQFVQSGEYWKILGHDGYLYVDGAKLKSSAKDLPLNAFFFKEHTAYFSIAQQQGLVSLLACEDGNLGNSTDIQVYAHSFRTDKWTAFSQIPDDDFRYLWKVDRADIRPESWMDQLPDKTKKLNELAICGTHDSCTWKWSSANYSRTQDLTILEQLKIGVRFVDIRLGPDFETYHGGKNDVSFQDVINDIATFLSNSSSRNETIIMVIAGGDGLASFATDLRDVVNRTSKRITNNLSWFAGNRIPALNEVQGKVVLLRRYKDEQPNPPGIDLSMWGPPVHSNDSFSATGIGGVTSMEVQDEYYLTQNSTKKGHIEKLLPSMAVPAPTSQHWYINFTSAAKAQKPSWYSNDINPWLGAQLNFHQFMRGTFVMDYPSAAIVDRIIQFNFQ